MTYAKRLALLGILFLGIASSPCAWAAVDPANDALALYFEVTQSFVEKAKTAGLQLVFLLLGIQITINGIKHVLKPSELESLVGAIIWPLISATFFAGLISVSDTWLPRLVGSFEHLGQQAGNGMSLSPGEFVFYGIDVAMQAQEAFNKAAADGAFSFIRNFFPAMFLLFIQIVVVLSFAVLGLQMALALINAYFFFAITPILLGFGGLSYTRDMAISSLKGGIAVGMKLMVIYFIAAVALRMAPLWGELIGTISLTNFKPFWVVGTSVAIFAYLANQVPKLASDLLNGTASLTAGDAASNTMMGMAALATAGAGTVAAAQAAKQAGTSASETLSKIMQSGSGGSSAGGGFGGGPGAISQAFDGGSSAGQSGGVFGGSMSGMLDTSRSGSKAGGGDASSGGGAGKDSGASSSPAGGQAGDRNGGGGASGSADLGDGTQAKLSSRGGNGSGSVSNEQLADQLAQYAANMDSQRQPSTADKIRNLAGYIPNDNHSVGVNAQLGGGDRE